MLWGLGALVTVFYLLNIYNGMRNDIRQQYYSDYDALLAYFRQSTDMTRDIRYMNERFVENKEVRPGEPADRTTDGFLLITGTEYQRRLRGLPHRQRPVYYCIQRSPDVLAEQYRRTDGAESGLSGRLKTLCMVSFPIRNLSTSSETLRRMVNDYSQNYFRLKSQGKSAPFTGRRG